MALIAPDPKCVEVDVGARRYRGNRLTDVPPADAALLRRAGYIDSGPAGPPSGGGYVCPCGFRPYIATCSRCGQRAVRA